MEDTETTTAAVPAAPSDAGGDDFGGEDFSAIDAILAGDDPPPQKEPAPEPVAATPPPADSAPPTKTESAPPADLPADKLLALLVEKKRVTQEVSGDLQKLATEKAELARMRAELADSKALLDMARRDPAKFYRDQVKAGSLEQVAKDLYFADKGEKAPEQYQATQRTRELEAELHHLRQQVESQSERMTSEKVAQENARLVGEYKARAKEAVAKHDAKQSPWTARAFAKNPEKVMEQLVGLASYVARERGEVVEPQELIPILEAGMVEQFGKYDFGEARPTTTLTSSLSTPPKRVPVPGSDDRDSLMEETIRGIVSGEAFRE